MIDPPAMESQPATSNRSPIKRVPWKCQESGCDFETDWPAGKGKHMRSHLAESVVQEREEKVPAAPAPPPVPTVADLKNCGYYESNNKQHRVTFAWKCLERGDILRFPMRIEWPACPRCCKPLNGAPVAEPVLTGASPYVLRATPPGLTTAVAAKAKRDSRDYPAPPMRPVATPHPTSLAALSDDDTEPEGPEPLPRELSETELLVQAYLGREGAKSQKDIRDAIQKPRRTIWSALDRLIKRNVVESRPSLVDTRQKIYRLARPAPSV